MSIYSGFRTVMFYFALFCFIIFHLCFSILYISILPELCKNVGRILKHFTVVPNSKWDIICYLVNRALYLNRSGIAGPHEHQCVSSNWDVALRLQWFRLDRAAVYVKRRRALLHTQSYFVPSQVHQRLHTFSTEHTSCCRGILIYRGCPQCQRALRSIQVQRQLRKTEGLTLIP